MTKLTKLQKEMLHGLILGDLHVRLQPKERTPRLMFEQGNCHKEYLFHLYFSFKEYVKTEPKQNKKGNWHFSTLSKPVFAFFRHQYYTEDGLKVVPKLIHRYLTPISLAYWYMDDGSMKSKDSKGVFLNTQNFSKKEVEQLCSTLKKNFGLISKARPVYESRKKTGEKDFRKRKILYYQLYISGYSYQKLRSLIYDHLQESMKYKFPVDRTKVGKQRFNKHA